jgi:hypothetical protein
VRLLTGREIRIYVAPGDRIEDVKDVIRERGGLPGPMRLLFAGKPLEDEKTIGDYAISSGSTIHMVLSLRRRNVNINDA